MPKRISTLTSLACLSSLLEFRMLEDRHREVRAVRGEDGLLD